MSMSQQGREVLEGEVDKSILDQLNVLRKALFDNKTMAEEFAVNVSEEQLHKLEEDIQKTTRFLNEQKSLVSKERLKISALSGKVVKDGRMAHQVSRRHEMLTKNPQYGRMQAIEYMHDVAGTHEQNLEEQRNTLAKLEKTLGHLTEDSDMSNIASQKDLRDHIQRFDDIFGSVASQVYAANEEVERVKDMYLEQRRKLYGRYATDPFQKHKEREKVVDVFANLKGMDAFPSQSAILSMSQYLPKHGVVQQTAPTFGAGPTLGSSGFGTSQLGANPTVGGQSFFGPTPTKYPSLGNAASGMGSSAAPFAFNNPTGSSFGRPFASTTSAAATLTLGQPQQQQSSAFFGSPAAPVSSSSTLFGQQQQPTFGNVSQPLQLQQPPASATATFPAANRPLDLSNFAPSSTPSIFGSGGGGQQQQQHPRLQLQPASNFQTQMHNAGGTLFQSSKPLFGKQ